MFMRDHTPKYSNVEVLLPGYQANYRNWNNNCGFVNEEFFSGLLEAFSHWTYVTTDKYLIVVDLQGIEEDDLYIFTDSSIHCEDPKFGKTNLGDVGIKQFFKT